MTEDEYQSLRVEKTYRTLKWLGILALIVLPLLAGYKCAFADWEPGHKWLASTATALSLMDMAQTRACMNRENCYEVGVVASEIWGPKPSKAEVHKMAAIRTALYLGVAHLLPSSERYGWLAACNLASGLTVYNNHREGLPPDWGGVGTAVIGLTITISLW